MPPTLGHGKLCYLMLPAQDIQRSAAFYTSVFGWQTRLRGDGVLAFDDGVGEVSGTWVTGVPPAGSSGLMLYIWVDDIHVTMAAIEAEGCDIVQPIGSHPGELTAHFRDPAGNVLGIFQEQAR